MSDTPYFFEPGDRTPNFTLPDRQGRYVMFYAWVEGRPVVLQVAGDLASARPALAAFRARADELAQAGIDTLAIVRGSVAEVASLTDGVDARTLTVLADPDGQVTTGLGAANSVGSPRLMLLDPNQRITGVLDGVPSQAQAAAALEWHRAHPVTPASGAAPVLMVPRVLDPATCDRLIERWHSQNEEGRTLAVVGGQVRDGVQSGAYAGKKHTRDHYITDAATFNLVSQLIVRRVGPELNKAFGFGGAFRFDSHSILRYAADRGDRFDTHRDNSLPQSAHRRFAISLNLNDDFDGGELCFPEYGGTYYRPMRGEACLFSCSLLHAARPVTRGERFVLVSIIADLPAATAGAPGPRPAPR